MSVFLSKPVLLDIAPLRTGLGWAQSWAKSPILCKIGDGWLRLFVVEPEGFLASWSYPVPSLKTSLFFLLPSFVARTLSGPAAWEIDQVQVMTNRNIVGMIVTTGRDQLRFQWQWLADDFKAPREFTLMSQLPDMLVSTPYVSLADMVHLAMANLIKDITDGVIEEPQQQDNSIMIDFAPGYINIDGEAITPGTQARYFFKPKMLVRGLEIVRENQVGFMIRPINHGQDAVLYLTCQREGWQVHGAVLSTGVSKDVAPARIIRQTRQPLQDGPWIKRKPS